MWRRNRWIQQKNCCCHQSQRWCRSRNHRFNRRNQLTLRRNCQQSHLIRNLRQQRSCPWRSQKIRRRRIRLQIRKRCLSYGSLRTHHWKIINHRSQHQRRNLSYGRIKQIRIFQPYHGPRLSCLHLLLRIPQQRYLKNGRLESFYRCLHCWWLKERSWCWSWIQSPRSWIRKNQKRCLIS